MQVTSRVRVPSVSWVSIGCDSDGSGSSPVPGASAYAHRDTETRRKRRGGSVVNLPTNVQRILYTVVFLGLSAPNVTGPALAHVSSVGEGRGGEYRPNHHGLRLFQQHSWAFGLSDDAQKQVQNVQPVFGIFAACESIMFGITFIFHPRIVPNIS